MSGYKNLELEIKDNIAKIRFINTEKLNPLDINTSTELMQILDELESKDTVRVIVITGSGRSFSAGGDIKKMKESIDNGIPDKFMDELTDKIYKIVYKLRTYSKPIIAAVNGYCIGAGMNLALGCDLIIASEKAKFAESFCKLGLIPGALGTYLLIRQIPWQKAAEYCFTGEMIPAEELYKLGLINKIVPHDQLEEEVMKLAKKLAEGPTLAYARTKKLFMEALNNSMDVHLENERQMQIKSALTEDYKIGVNALINKETPKFIGK